MDKYLEIVEAVQIQADLGFISEDTANSLLEYAYYKYYNEDIDYFYEAMIKTTDYRRKNENGLINTPGVIAKKKIEELTGNTHKKRHIERSAPSIVADSAKVLATMHKKATKAIEKNEKVYKCDAQTHQKLVELEKRMRNDVDFSGYKKAYKEFTKIIGIPSEHINIRYITWSNDGKDKWSCKLTYRYNEKHFKLPEGYELYHMSPMDGLKYLYPTFKGKRIGEDRKPHMNGTGELYSNPRVFFSIRKEVSPLVAGLKSSKTDVKRHLYRAAENLNGRVYVDMTMTPFVAGAIYVETDSPIRVVQIQ